MSLATFQTLMESASTALAAGEYANAITYATRAKAILSTVLQMQRAGGGNSQSLSPQYSLAAVDSFIADCRKLQTGASHATSGLFTQLPVTYQRPSTTEDYQ
jgi:hypothetical protein